VISVSAVACNRPVAGSGSTGRCRPNRLISYRTPATFVGGLTMSERVVDEGQSWASDIIGVLSGVGLYSVLIFLVPFLCLYVPA
jgi:hypothetical protein